MYIESNLHPPHPERAATTILSIPLPLPQHVLSIYGSFHLVSFTFVLPSSFGTFTRFYLLHLYILHGPFGRTHSRYHASRSCLFSPMPLKCDDLHLMHVPLSYSPSCMACSSRISSLMIFNQHSPDLSNVLKLKVPKNASGL